MGLGQTVPGSGTLLAIAWWMCEKESLTENSTDPSFKSEGVVLRIRKCNQPSRGAPHPNGDAASSSRRPAGAFRMVLCGQSDSSSLPLPSRRCQFFKSPLTRSPTLVEPSGLFSVNWRSAILSVISAVSSKPYVAKVALEMSFPEERYVKDGVGLKVLTKAQGSSVPIAIAKAIALAFEDPSVKQKEPAYINMSVTVVSRWAMADVIYAKLP